MPANRRPLVAATAAVVVAVLAGAGCAPGEDGAATTDGPASTPSTTSALEGSPPTTAAADTGTGPALRGEDLSGIRMRDLVSGTDVDLESALAAPNDTPVLAFFWAPF